MTQRSTGRTTPRPPGRGQGVGHARGTGRARRSQPRTNLLPTFPPIPADLQHLPKLRNSERSCFKRCHWKWWMEFVEVAKPKTERPPLRFGTLCHIALAAYYPPGKKRGPKPWLTFEQAYEAEQREQESFGFRPNDDEDWIEAGELGDLMLRNYVDHYGDDDEWEVVVTEQPFWRLVYHPESYDPNHPPEAQQGAEPWFIVTGVLDGIWRSRRTGRLRLVDHKTAKAIQTGYLSLDGQATMYLTFGLDWVYENGLLKPNERLDGMMYNFLRKARPDERPKDAQGRSLNKDGSVSQKQPSPYFARVPIDRGYNEREALRDQILYEFADLDAVRNADHDRDGTSAPPGEAYKNQGQFTCPGCGMFDICELHEIGADWREMQRQIMKTWEPYEVHEIYAAETI